MESHRRPGLAKCIWFGMGQFGLVLLGLSRFDWVWFGFGLVWFASLKKL